MIRSLYRFRLGQLELLGGAVVIAPKQHAT